MNKTRALRAYSIITVLMLLVSSFSSFFLLDSNVSSVSGEEILKPLSTITGTSTENHFGWNVSWAGDINGDGFDDIIAGAPYAYSGISGGKWWDSSWIYRRKLAFDNSQQAEDLVNFPVLVNLSHSNFNYSRAKTDGSDLRFIDTDAKTQLNYHIEEWNPLGNSYIWVNVSQILGGSSSDFIWMYYGNPGAINNQNIEGTYNENYMAVWHLNETSGIHYDATSNNNDGTPQGDVTQNEPGNIDGADSFDGAGDYIDFGTSDSLNITSGITIEAWVKPINIDHGSPDLSIVGKFGAIERSYALYLDDDVGDSDDWEFRLSSDGATVGGSLHSSNSADKNSWQYVVATWNGSDMLFYKNGMPIESPVAFSGPIFMSTTDLWIGDGTYYGSHEGLIDEVRLSDVARSADWIAAQYLSMDNRFTTYNPEEINTWWNSSWQFRKKLTFDNSGQAEDLFDFPVLVKLNPANFDFINAKSDGTDLRFIDEDGITLLSYHIESWDPAKSSYVWVNIPRIDSGSSIDFIWMYYGNPAASDVRDVSGTYNSDYLGVWHLNETVGSHFDATSNNINGAPTGGVLQDETGPLNGADSFDQIDDHIQIDPISLENYTISLWAKGDGTLIGYENVSLKTSLDLGTENPDTAIYGERGEDQLGYDVSSGDINGDGINDTVIGSVGSVFVIYGDALRPDPYLVDLNSQNANLTIRGDAHSRFGTKVATGDVNNDGFDDVIVGSIFEDPLGRPDSGAAHVIYGSDYGSGTEIDLNAIPANITIYGKSMNDNLGRAVASGDINNDGIDDLVIGASGVAPGGRGGAGATYVIYGDNFGSTVTIDLNSQPANLTIYGNEPGDASGIDVISGDFNNDGFDDIIIGASGADPPGGNFAGEAYVIYGMDYASGTVIDLNFVSANYTIFGDDADDNLGRVVGSGDVNKDGYDDVILGVYWADPPGGNQAGEVCVIFGADYVSGTFVDLNSTSANLTIYGDDMNDYLGFSVSAGDINDDGFDDVIMGAYGTSPSGGNDAGSTYIIYGMNYAPGTTIDLNSTSANLTIHGDDMSDLSGFAVSSGDMNDDGFTDVIIGAYGADPPGGVISGETYVIYGADWSSGTIIDLDSGPANFTIQGDNGTDTFGISITSGDVNADGYDDLIIGAYTAVTPGGFDAGKTYVFYGRTGFTPTLDLVYDSADITISGDDPGDYSGYSVSSGDVNSDGYDDIIIGAYGADVPGGINAGAAYIVYGGNYASGTVIDLNAIPADITIYGNNPGDNLGRAVASGDVNNDGFDDVIVGSTWADSPSGSNEGAAYVIFGSNYAPGTIIDLDLVSSNLTIHGKDATDFCGLALATGDVNNDGYNDVVVGAYGSDHAGGNEAGETYVIYGRDFAPGSVIDLGFESANLTVYGNGTTAYLGFAVSSGDINNDGYSDVIIGSYQADPLGRNDAGEVYVIYGGNFAPGSSIDLSSESADLTILGDDAYDRMGYSVFSEDVDNDGISDLIMGAFTADQSNGNQNGEIYVIFGSDYPSGKVIDLNLNNANLTVYGIDSADRMGSAIHTTDINGDGYPEIIAGAHEADFKNRFNSGEVYIINPLSTAEIIKAETIDGRIRTVFAPNRNSSSVISPLVNTKAWHLITFSKGDSLKLYYDGILIGSENLDDASILNSLELTIGSLNKNGTLRNYFGGTIDEVKILRSSASQNWISAQYLSESDNFISYSIEEDREAYSGCAYIFFGYTGFTQNDLYTSYADVVIYGENPEDLFGLSVSGAGDINSDGSDDIIIGAPGWSNDKGRAYTFYGRSAWNQSYGASEADVILGGENEGDRFGASLAGLKTPSNQMDIYKEWLYRKKITINSSQVVDDLVDFPVLVNISDTNLRSKARPDGNDIFFTALDGSSRLNHEVERYNGVTGELSAWVKIPSLSSSSDTSFYMYYGNSDQITPMENPSYVWDVNYSAVWHLHDDYLDSTRNDHDGINSGSADYSGLIADGQYFKYVNTSDRINVGNWNVQGKGLTLQAWIMFESMDSDARIISKSEDPANQSHTWMLSERNDKLRLRVRTDTTTTMVASSGDLFPGIWYFAVGTYDGTNMILRLNNMEVGRTAKTGDIQEDIREIAIGNQPQNPFYPFDGIIDEVRVSSIRRSDAWLDTEFNNIINQTMFYSIDEEEINANSWEYRKPITIDPSQIASDLTDFPLLVNITDSELKDKARTDGYDIVFTASDGNTRLDHEMENYNGSTGDLVAWVRIPLISSSSDTVIYMHYGNNLINSSTENPSGVWDPDYSGVWHLDEDGTGTRFDSTENTNHGTPVNYEGDEAISSGKIAGADEFDGDNDRVSVPHNSSLNPQNDITVEAWVRFNELSSTRGSEQKIVFKDHSNPPWVAFELRMDLLDQIMIQWVDESQNYKTAGYFGSVSTDTWYYIVGVKSGNSLNFYLNSDTGSTWTDSTSGLMFNSDGPLHFATEGTQSYLNGSIDEVRVSKAARTWDWINTSYKNQNQPGSFYTIGREDINPKNWPFRKSITIRSSEVLFDLLNFPILVSITDPDLKNKARPDGSDIVFAGSDTMARLDHEIERYDGITGELIAWIRVPSLSSSTDTRIYMYYGNSDGSDKQNIEGVWKNGYVGVYHMAEETGDINNSATPTNDGARVNTPTRDIGKIGFGQNFTGGGVNDNFNVGDLGLADGVNENITMSAWMNVNDPDLVLWSKIISKRNQTETGYVYAMNFADQPSNKQVYSIVRDQSSDPWFDVANGTWIYLSTTYNGAELITYRDETKIGNNILTGPLWSSTQDVTIGGRLDPTQDYAGTLDEIRFSNVPRPPEWIETEFNNQNNPGTFSSVGPEEPLGNNQSNSVLIGAYGYDNERGRAYVFSGSGGLSGEVAASSADVIINGSSQGDHFAWDVSFAGDVNNDGPRDIIVGAPAYDMGTGAAYIFYSINSLTNYLDASDADLFFTGEAVGDGFGFSVSSAKDVNNDGFDDVIIGAPLADNLGVNMGSAYIFFGNSTMDSVYDVHLEGKNDNDNFGYSVSSASDFNGDGISDVVVGAPFLDAGPILDAGAIYVFNGGSGIDSFSDAICLGSQTYEHFGWSTSSSKNLDNHTLTYIIVGAPDNIDGGLNAGKIFIINGRPTMAVISNVVIFPPNQLINEFVNISCEITGPGGIDSEWVNISTPGGGFMNVSMVQGPGDQYFYYDIYTQPGIYQFTIFANDSLGNIIVSSPYQFEILTGDPLLSLEQVIPLAGLINTDFNFTVQYTHPSNLTPDMFTVNITGPSHSGSWDMVEVDPADTDFTDGKSYYYNYTGFSVGAYSFNFAANDSAGNWVESSAGSYDVVDSQPLLSLEQVDPVLGYPSWGFNFTVVYTHPSNLPPDMLTVNITGPSHAGSWDMVEGDLADTDYSDGKSFYYNFTGFSMGSYTFHIAANDTNGIWDETPSSSFDVLDESPVLSLQQVGPSSGYIDTYFNFSTVYTSVLDLPPWNITVNISGVGVIDLVEVEPMDSDYTDGKEYYLKTSGFSVGDHAFHFAARDTNGNWVEGATLFFDVLNSTPLLTSPFVDPTSGYEITNFNFTVTYTSPNDLPPDNMLVNISGRGSYNLDPVDPLDTDHTDGKEYYLVLSGFTFGPHSFHFAANDTNGIWVETTSSSFDILSSALSLTLPSVDPPSGYIDTPFNFTVNYASPADLPPLNINVTILGFGTFTLSGSDPLDTDYTDGKDFYFNFTGFTIRNYSFYFQANDIIGNQVISGTDQFSILNRPPLLSSPQVAPNSGDISSGFNFSVIFEDPEDRPPNKITVNISGYGIFDLTESDPMDVDYSDGKEYYYNATGFSVGSFTFKFAANDSEGVWVETGSLGFNVTNRAPTLISPQVNPISGFIDSDLNFTVIYLDLDNHEPGRITVNISGIGTYDLTELDPMDLNYFDGKLYYFSISGISLGSYTFHFASNDSVGEWVETGNFGFDVINREPTLTLPNVGPSLGYMATHFNFSVTYTDLDDQAPGSITVNISGAGIFDLSELDPMDLDFYDGKIYYLNITGFSLGPYTVHFAANDSIGDWVESFDFGFDVINRLPVLTSPKVDPQIGYIGSGFNFTVMYTDLDNEAPVNILVNITGYGSYSLVESDPLDMDRSDGKEYYLNASGISLGLHSFNFAASDPAGDWTESSVLQFDVVNRVPTLSFGGVKPLVDCFNAWFNFTVTYLDPDGDPPSYVVVNISGLGSFVLHEVDTLDTDYSEGKSYYYNVTNLPVGSYSFHFAANDSGGLWANETQEISGLQVMPLGGTLTISDIYSEFSDDLQIEATLKNGNNMSIANEFVSIYIDLNGNGIYEPMELVGNNETDSNGSIVVDFVMDMIPGIWKYAAIYNGSMNYMVADSEAHITIDPKPASLLAVSNDVEAGMLVDLSAILIDFDSNQVQGEEVAFYIDVKQDGIFEVSELISTSYTSSEGVAVISYLADLPPGDYGFRAKYVGSVNYSVNDIDGVLTVYNSTDRPPIILITVPHQTKAEDSPPWTLDLTEYEDDLEDVGADLKWFITGVDDRIYTVTGMNSTNDELTFIPKKDAFGNDETTLWLVDSSGNMVTQTLWINITPVNDPPHFNPLPPNLYVHYDDPNDLDDDPGPWDYTFYVHDIETPLEDLVLSTSQPPVDRGEGYAEVNGLSVTFHYPESRVGDSILVTLKISDGTDFTNTAILVNVTTDWVPKLIEKLPNVVLKENSTLYNVFDLDDHFTDKDHNSLFFTSGFFHIQVTINENNTVDIASSGDWTGEEFVTFRAKDPIGAIVEDTIKVTVIPVNDGPVISGVPDLVVHYDYSYAFDLAPYITDPDNATVDLQVSSSELIDYIWVQSANNLGIVVNYPGIFNGMTIPVTLYVTDGYEWDSQEIQITVTDDFPPELISKLPDVFFSEDAQIIGAFSLADYFFDFDGDALFYTNGSQMINITINDDLSVDFSAPKNWFGSELVTFRATDPHGAIAEDRVLVVVIPVNDAPEIDNIPKQERINADEWTLDLAQFIKDVDNDPSELEISVASDFASGYVRLVGNMLIFRYPDDIYEDIVTVSVSDGDLETKRSFIVTISRPEPAIPSIWEMIPWVWVLAVLAASLLGILLFFRRHSRFWVYEVFLIHDKGLPLAHASQKESSDLEEVVVSGMFTAVQDFINDAFMGKTDDDDWELDEMKFGENKILIERQENLFLAVIFGGNGDRLRIRVKKLLSEINSEFSSVLNDWDGDMSKLKGLRAMTMKLLSKRPERKEKKVKPELQIPKKEEHIQVAEIQGKHRDVPYQSMEILDQAILEAEALFYETDVHLASNITFEMPKGPVTPIQVAQKMEHMDCPVCGADYTSSDNSCNICGTEFGRLKKMFDDLQEEMPKCPSCSTPLEKETRICPVCGYDLRGSKKEITVFECPECGGSVDENARFCSQCGVEFIE